jgi:hypothetical protein
MRGGPSVCVAVCVLRGEFPCLVWIEAHPASSMRLCSLVVSVALFVSGVLDPRHA